MKITFNDNISKATEFVKTCKGYKSDIDLIVDKHYIVDGKSMLGVLAYAGGYSLEVEINAINTAEQNRFVDEMCEKFGGI